jgi:hypothetical protein
MKTSNIFILVLLLLATSSYGVTNSIYNFDGRTTPFNLTFTSAANQSYFLEVPTTYFNYLYLNMSNLNPTLFIKMPNSLWGYDNQKYTPAWTGSNFMHDQNLFTSATNGETTLLQAQFTIYFSQIPSNLSILYSATSGTDINISCFNNTKTDYSIIFNQSVVIPQPTYYYFGLPTECLNIGTISNISLNISLRNTGGGGDIKVNEFFPYIQSGSFESKPAIISLFIGNDTKNFINHTNYTAAHNVLLKNLDANTNAEGIIIQPKVDILLLRVDKNSSTQHTDINITDVFGNYLTNTTFNNDKAFFNITLQKDNYYNILVHSNGVAKNRIYTVSPSFPIDTTYVTIVYGMHDSVYTDALYDIQNLTFNVVGNAYVNISAEINKILV